MTVANSSASLGQLFTLALVDPGPVGGASAQVTRHWLVNGVTIGQNSQLVIPAADQAITAYGGPFRAFFLGLANVAHNNNFA